MRAKMKMLRLLVMALTLVLVAGACTGGGEGEGEGGGDPALGGGEGAVEGAEQPERDVAQGGGLLQEVQNRGTLQCGVNNAVPGFGFTDQEGNFSGFDIDFCRVIAAAVLGDAQAVEFVALTAEQRFTALQSGEVDVLVRNTTWTAGRDGGEGAAFATTTFYDGQTMMVKADSGFQALEDMANASICTLSGTTTELNLTSEFNARDIPFTPVTFEDNDTLISAFRQGRCQGWTSDSSQLAGVRSSWPESEGGPDALRIFDETFSKEPLGPAVSDGDMQWYDAVNWAVIATMAAEEYGITSDNVQEMLNSDDPSVLALLGQPGGEEGGAVFDPGLGLENDFVVQIVEQVGNYAEIYNRNIGPDSPLGLERGLNSLYTEGGLHYPPPFR